MKRKLINIAILFALIMSGITIYFQLRWNSISYYEQSRMQIVALNEIQNLSEEASKSQKEAARSQLKNAIAALQEDLRREADGNNQSVAKNIVWTMYLICMMFLSIILCYVYYMVLRPFDKLKDFANEIAKGNFDTKLKVERANFFGAFTWAFDHMRREITRARSCEKEAIDNNKIVIATLSHDIKTPIASIRAYAEGLDANLDTNVERRRRYIDVIMNKCDEVSNLTNDLFLHALADLDKLKMNIEPVEISHVLLQTVKELSVDMNDIIFKGEIQNAIVLLDPKRFQQVLENLINNSRKYAQSKIEISTMLEENNYMIVIRDYGRGILDEDIPFVFDKFYRGKNVGDKQGAGLGLYIVKYICEQMKGDIVLHNDTQGLVVVITLPTYKDNVLKIS